MYNHYIILTHKYFDGEVLCKRIPVSPLTTDDKNNTYIKGENNTSEDNAVIKGENNVNRNNVYIAGSNNTITGNTHYQGSNNIYEDNIVIGSSDNTINNTTTYGESNRIVKGQIMDRSDKNNSHTNKSSYSVKHEDEFLNSKPVKTVLLALIGVPLLFFMILYIFDGFLIPLYSILIEAPFFTSLVIIVIGIALSIYYKIYFLLLPITVFALFCIHKYLQHKRKQEETHIEYERKEQERKQKEREARLAYEQEQKRISNLPVHYAGNIETGKYHHCDCSYAKRLHKSKKEYFETADNAEKHGYIPCSVCNFQHKNKKEGLSCEKEKHSP